MCMAEDQLLAWKKMMQETQDDEILAARRTGQTVSG
jgi:hypothetical protein